MVQINTTSGGKSYHGPANTVYPEEHSITSVELLPEFMAESGHEDTSDRPRLKVSHQNEKSVHLNLSRLCTTGNTEELPLTEGD